MVHCDGVAEGTLRRSIDPLRPDASEAITVRHEVDEAAVRRPSWLIIKVFAARNRNPIALRNRRVSKRHRPQAAPCRRYHLEKDDPSAITAEVWPVQHMLFVAGYSSRVASRQIHRSNDRAAVLL